MESSIPTQSVSIRNTATKAVTLYPNKAQITRAINSIGLQPGPNTVVITGITPTCDEHSIKVDGTGSATITDLSIELVDNPEVYLDIYPDEEDDVDTDLPDVSDDEPEVEGRLKMVRDRLHELDLLSKRLNTERWALQKAAQICEAYAAPSSATSASLSNGTLPLGEMVESYLREMKKGSDRIAELDELIKDQQKEVRKIRKEEQRLTLEERNAQRKKDRLEQKSQVKEQRREREKAKEKKRIHEERVRFWPKKVYRVTISLEAPDGLTPMSSRRGSTTSVESVMKETARSGTPIGEAEVNLTLNYITTSASWSPRYDLSLSTVSSTGQLDYSAELRNTTSEAWKDAKITLSTSSSSYGGLTDKIPELLPWHLRLISSENIGGFNHRLDDSALRAPYEVDWATLNPTSSQKVKRREDLFGLDREYLDLPASRHKMRKEIASMAARRGPDFDSMERFDASIGGAQPSYQRASGRSQPITAYGFSTARAAAAPGAGMVQAFGSVRPPNKGGQMAYRKAVRDEEASDDEEEEEDDDDDDATVNEAIQALLVEEVVAEESGLTTTYDLPGLKTLAPTSKSSKHKITRLQFKDVTYSHIIVPKLRAAAFLKAKLKNTSKIGLLKGECGLTLDGTFLGHASLPRCEKSESFTLNLGVDPAVQVSYSKPTVRRGTSGSGLFGSGKENMEIYTRLTTITNTKAGAPLELTVLEQVPVSEDERLKIVVLEPRGLVVGGGRVRAGGAKQREEEEERERGEWGSGTAVLKKGGEVSFLVKIRPGKGCQVGLEYEVAYPSGGKVMSV